MNRIFFVLLCIGLLQACNKRLVVDAPTLQSQIESEELPLSEISVPIQIPYKSIELGLEKKQGNLIYEDQSFDDNSRDNIKLKITKTKPFAFKGLKEYIRITLPLHIWVDYRYEACSFCPEVLASTSFDANITFTSRLGLRHDWTLDTKTDATSFEITRDPYLKVGPTQINIKSMVEKILSEQLKALAITIDKQLNEGFNLKKKAEETWKMIQKPILIDSSYQAWIRIEPNEFTLAPIVCNDRHISLNGGLKTRIITSFGPLPNSKILPLTPLNISQPSKQFRVELEIDLPFKEARKIAFDALKDTVFMVTKNKFIKIDELDIFGNNGEIFIKVFTSGSLRSIFYLKGTPAYDELKQEFYLKNLDYSLSTQQSFVKAANWLLKSNIRNQISKAFRYSMKDDFDAAKAALTQYLNNYQYEELFVVNGGITQLNFKKVSSDNNRIYAILSASGKAQIEIKNISF